MLSHIVFKIGVMVDAIEDLCMRYNLTLGRVQLGIQGGTKIVKNSSFGHNSSTNWPIFFIFGVVVDNTKCFHLRCHLTLGRVPWGIQGGAKIVKNSFFGHNSSTNWPIFFIIYVMVDTIEGFHLRYHMTPSGQRSRKQR